MKRAGAALLLIVAVAALARGGDGLGNGGPAEATIAIHFSRFSPETVELPAGEPVTITLRNDDPIEHEWIVGPAEVHERHRNGTEPFHDQIPTEVTIPALVYSRNDPDIRPPRRLRLYLPPSRPRSVRHDRHSNRRRELKPD